MVSMLIGHTGEVLQQFPPSKNPSCTNSGEHKADSFGLIPNVSKEFDPVSSSGDVLCESCSEFHFECRCTVTATSTVGTTLSRGNCPSCRLISHCINSSPREQSIPSESHIVLRAAPLFIGGTPGRQGKHVNVPPKRIEIRLCMQKLKREGAIEMNDRDVIGVLLPVKGDESSDSAGPTSHEVLFNTLKYEGSIYARPITYTVDVKLLRAWIDFCTISHSSCTMNKIPSVTNVGLRLIDVVERCLVDATLAEEYIALSYVWGSDNIKVLTESTMRHLREKGGLSSTAIPRLVVDVMDFVAKIGERYLWIDTVCIVQDDDLDKQRQLPNMSSIYTHAKFTIVAAVEGPNDPLPRWNKCHHELSLPTELIRGIAHTVGEPPITTALIQTTWNRRGWTFQEAFLARRLLVFTENLVYWNCREESWCEDQYTEFHDVIHEPTPETSLFATRVRGTFCNGNETSTELCAMGQYKQHARTYSKRSFGNYSDVVWAFIGILNAKKEHFPNGYIWTLPYDQLDAALLWLTCGEHAERAEHQCNLSPESRLPIPSWCWIGKRHGIWFLDGICETKSRVTWHEPVKCLLSDIDTVEDDQELVSRSQMVLLPGAQPKTEESVIVDYAFLHFTAETTVLCIELDSNPSNMQFFNTHIEKKPTESGIHPFVAANIILPSERAIGQIRVPVNMFRNNTRRFVDFVLLSEYIGEIHSEPPEDGTPPVAGWKSGKSSDHHRDADDAGSLHREEEVCEHHIIKDNLERRINPEEHKEGCEHQPALNLMLIEWDETRKIENFARRVTITRINPSAWEEVETTKKMIVLG